MREESSGVTKRSKKRGEEIMRDGRRGGIREKDAKCSRKDRQRTRKCGWSLK